MDIDGCSPKVRKAAIESNAKLHAVHRDLWPPHLCQPLRQRTGLGLGWPTADLRTGSFCTYASWLSLGVGVWKNHDGFQQKARYRFATTGARGILGCRFCFFHDFPLFVCVCARRFSIFIYVYLSNKNVYSMNLS